MPEETWRAVRSILDDPTRKPPRGVRTLLGGLALCPCGNVVTGMPSHTGYHIYRCTPATRNRAYHGGHVARQAEPVETFVEKLVVARLSRPDAADLVSVEEAGVDVAGLREEAAAIRMLSDDEWAAIAHEVMHRTGLSPYGQEDEAVRWVAATAFHAIALTWSSFPAAGPGLSWSSG